MRRHPIFLLAAVLAASLVGCSDLPSNSVSTSPAQPLALVAPEPVPSNLVSARLETPQPILAPTPVEIPPPALPESVPVVEAQFAVVPERLDEIEVWSAPTDDAAPLITFDRFDEFAQVRLFRILADYGSFFEVQVPMRPNGSIGYIRRDDVDVRSTDQRILIDLSDRSVIVWNGNEVVFDATGTVGDARTPTPTGSFYVRNAFEWDATSVYGPWVFPLSAYSEAIDQINGGDAVIAIHGTRRPDLIGEAASLGCFRLENGVLRELAALIEPGAPVDIVP